MSWTGYQAEREYENNPYWKAANERSNKFRQRHNLTVPEIQENTTPPHPELSDLVNHQVSNAEEKAYAADTGRTGWTLPFSSYEGPGNSVNNGPPRGVADAVAQIHDAEYFDTQYRYEHEDINKAEAEEEVNNEDKQAIKSFNKGNSFGHVLGHDGLTFKHWAEKLVGHQYPGFVDRPDLLEQYNDGTLQHEHLKELLDEASQSFKTYQTDQMSLKRSGAQVSQSSNKLSRTGGSSLVNAQASADSTSTAGASNNTNVASSDSLLNMPLTGTGAETASGGASSDGQMKHVIPRPFSTFGDRVNVYTKCHKFMTFGLAPAIIVPVASSGASWLTSYLAEIPWHIPALYLNQSEYNLLNEGVHVVGLELEVVYRGSTIQFETASSATGLATLNQINDVAVANGLNRSGQGSNVSYSGFSASEPMIPTSIKKPVYGPLTGVYRGMVRDFYGSNQTETTFVGDIPKHQIGRQCFLYNYWAQSLIGPATPAQPNTIQSGGWPSLAGKIEQMDGKTVVNTCVMKSSYTPKMAPLKTPLRTLSHGLPTTSNGNGLAINVNAHISQLRTATLTAAAGAIPSDGMQLGITETALTTGTANQVTYNIYTPIEKSQFARTGPWSDFDAHIQPSVHIGVQPVPALTTAALLAEDGVFNNWTDTRSYWEVTAKMYTKEGRPTEYPYANAPNVPIGDNIFMSNARPAVNDNPRDDGATFAGLYTGASSGLTNN